MRPQKGRGEDAEHGDGQIGATGQKERDPQCQRESPTMCKTTQLGATLRLISECIMQMTLGFFFLFFFKKMLALIRAVVAAYKSGT